MKEKTLNSDLKFSTEHIISEEFKDLLLGMMHKNPNKRLSLSKVIYFSINKNRSWRTNGFKVIKIKHKLKKLF
jgi:hypothetical protein